MPDIWFPNLGIEIQHLSSTAFTIFGLDIAWYGIMIALGVALGYGVAAMIAKKTGQSPDFYLDFLIYALIISVIGARLYYVIFSWEYYKDDLLQILNLRQGGLAIYGGVIGALLTAVVYAKKKKYSFWLLVDTAIPGLAMGQAIGRWGNFFNQEVFGGYTDGLFAMRLNVETAAYTTPELMEKAISLNGVTYIQVQPTFFYESAACFLLVILMVAMWKFRKFKGQIFCTYFIGYGLERFIVEGIRTDQLMLWGTNIPVSQALSMVFIVGGLVMAVILYRHHKLHPETAVETKEQNVDADDTKEMNEE